MRKRLFSIYAIIIFATLLTLSGTLFAEQEKESDIKIVSVQEANELIEENNKNPEFVILDVRTIEEHETGHIPDSVNINYKSSNFRDQISELDKEKIYVTYCRSGARSTKSAEIMKEVGFENIYMIDGGIVAWKKAGLPTSQNN
ncbi:MAG: rhodanese [Thermodesulfobacteriota bacterium]|nr:MAG: rhodanese [Thermodesulfobacteriota bacterium]